MTLGEGEALGSLFLSNLKYASPGLHCLKITLTLIEDLEQKHSWLLQGNSFLMKVLTYLKPEKLKKIQN